MTERNYNVLFLCTGNSARSILAEALLGVMGAPRFRSFSAGSHPAGRVQPLAVELAAEIGYETARLRSKSWDEFAVVGAPSMDIILTVCDNAAGESCPVWPGRPATAHWGVPDPAMVTGDQAERRAAFRATLHAIRKHVEQLVALPDERLEPRLASASLAAIAAIVASQ